MGREFGVEKPRSRSRSLAPLINALTSAFEEFAADTTCWVRNSDGSFVSGIVLSAPQPSSGRCVVRLANGECIQAHRSQLVADDTIVIDEDEATPRSAAELYPDIVTGARCVLDEGMGEKVMASVVTRPNEDGRCVVRVETGYGGGDARACRLVHAAQLTLFDPVVPFAAGAFGASCGGCTELSTDGESDDVKPDRGEEEKEEGASGENVDNEDSKEEDPSSAPAPAVVVTYASRDDPEFAPYYKMLKFGTPAPAVAHKMMKDQKDPRRIEETAPFAIDSDAGTSRIRPNDAESAQPPKKLKRRATVKQLPLDFHDSVGSNSIWADVHSLNGIELHRPEIEALFVQSTKGDNKTSKGGVGKLHSSRSGPIAEPVALSRKRATNVAISLAGGKLNALPPKVIRSALRRLDVSFFGITQLDALAAATPTAEEASLLQKQAEKDVKARASSYEGYAEAERFMLRVSLRVEFYARRVSALRFCEGFQERVKGLERSARILRAASTQVQTSPRLKKLLTYVLKLSRELEHAKSLEFQSPSTAPQSAATPPSTKKKVAGFRLASLLRLHELKAFDRQTSALEFIVGLMVKNNDLDTLDFDQEIPDAKHAQRISVSTCRDERTFLVNGIERLRKLLDETAESSTKRRKQRSSSDEIKNSQSCPALGEDKDSPPPTTWPSSLYSDDDDEDGAHENSSTTLSAFFEPAAEAVTRVSDQYGVARAAYESVLEYFGEDPKMPTQEFFEILVHFSDRFRETRKRYHAKNPEVKPIDEDERARARIASIDAKMLLMGKPKPPLPNSPNSFSRQRPASSSSLAVLSEDENGGTRRRPRASSSSALENMLQSRLGGVNQAAPDPPAEEERVSQPSALERMLQNRLGGGDGSASAPPPPRKRISPPSALESMLQSRLGGAVTTAPAASREEDDSFDVAPASALRRGDEREDIPPPPPPPFVTPRVELSTTNTRSPPPRTPLRRNPALEAMLRTRLAPETESTPAPPTQALVSPSHPEENSDEQLRDEASIEKEAEEDEKLPLPKKPARQSLTRSSEDESDFSDDDDDLDAIREISLY